MYRNISECIGMYRNTYEHIRIYTNIFEYMRIDMYIYACICKYAYIYACVCRCTYILLHMFSVSLMKCFAHRIHAYFSKLIIYMPTIVFNSCTWNNYTKFRNI